MLKSKIPKMFQNSSRDDLRLIGALGDRVTYIPGPATPGFASISAVATAPGIYSVRYQSKKKKNFTS